MQKPSFLLAYAIQVHAAIRLDVVGELILLYHGEF
jgi:hypothetical protein